MLMMSRREGETILIGDAVEIVIAHIGRSRVKVGIRAPREMPVQAREVKLVRDENQAAAVWRAPRSLGGVIREGPDTPSRAESLTRGNAEGGRRFDIRLHGR